MEMICFISSLLDYLHKTLRHLRGHHISQKIFLFFVSKPNSLSPPTPKIVNSLLLVSLLLPTAHR